MNEERFEKPRPLPEKVEPAAPVERPDVKVAAGVLRCPFCHDEVRTVGADWVACRSCLARHHAACWTESKKCATCGHEQSIAAGPPATQVLTGRARGGAPVVALVLGGVVAFVVAAGAVGFKDYQTRRRAADEEARVLRERAERLRLEYEAREARERAEEQARLERLRAEQALRAAETEVSTEARDWYAQGLAHVEKGELDPALDAFSMALQLARGWAAPYVQRAEVRRTKGDLAGALEDLEKALARTKPGTAEVRSIEVSIESIKAGKR